MDKFGKVNQECVICTTFLTTLSISAPGHELVRRCVEGSLPSPSPNIGPRCCTEVCYPFNERVREYLRWGWRWKADGCELTYESGVTLN